MAVFPDRPDDSSWQVQTDQHTEESPLFQQWRENMAQYARETGTDTCMFSKFYLVIRLKAEEYSKKIAYHESLPMWVPAQGCGFFAGVANDIKQLDKILTDDISETTGINKYVHLVYTVKIQGDQAWRDLLEFLGTHNMLEKS